MYLAPLSLNLRGAVGLAVGGTNWGCCLTEREGEMMSAAAKKEWKEIGAQQAPDFGRYLVHPFLRVITNAPLSEGDEGHSAGNECISVAPSGFMFIA